MLMNEGFFAPEVELRPVSREERSLRADGTTAGAGMLAFLQDLPANVCGIVVASLLLATTTPAMSELRVAPTVLDPPAAPFARQTGMLVLLGPDLQESQPVGAGFWSDQLAGEYADEHPEA